MWSQGSVCSSHWNTFGISMTSETSMFGKTSMSSCKFEMSLLPNSASFSCRFARLPSSPGVKENNQSVSLLKLQDLIDRDDETFLLLTNNINETPLNWIRPSSLLSLMSKNKTLLKTNFIFSLDKSVSKNLGYKRKRNVLTCLGEARIRL